MVHLFPLSSGTPRSLPFLLPETMIFPKATQGKPVYSAGKYYSISICPTNWQTPEFLEETQ